MDIEGIVPEIIDAQPNETLEISFSQKAVNFGNEFTPTEAKHMPEVKWNFEPNVYYSLAMVDIDAPNRERPIFREVNHWLVGNIQGNDISLGDTITEFLSSGPFKDSGLHRYVFLVYKQPKKLEFDEPRTIKTSRAHRLNFSLRKFAEKYQLGAPIAGNYYRAQWDSYVEERNKFITND